MPICWIRWLSERTNPAATESLASGYAKRDQAKPRSAVHTSSDRSLNPFVQVTPFESSVKDRSGACTHESCTITPSFLMTVLRQRTFYRSHSRYSPKAAPCSSEDSTLASIPGLLRTRTEVHAAEGNDKGSPV